MLFLIKLSFIQAKALNKEWRISAKNHVDTMIFHTAICAGASQIALDGRIEIACAISIRPVAYAPEWRIIMIKKNLFKFTSVLMCACIMALSLTACGASSDKTVSYNVQEESLNSNNTEDVLSNAINSQIKPSTNKENSKEETVFVFTDAKGNQDHLLINEKLKNFTGQKNIQDISHLTDIINLNGDESFSLTGSSLNWNANGKNITYQGTSDKKAPVTIKVSYYLDGKEISPEQIAGKSGKVKIRFDYINNEKKTITVNGKSQEAYVPFTMITGVVLPTDKFSNVTVSNGKILDNDNSSIVLGMAMPGLKESLDLSLDGKKADIDIPEYFEVTADAVDFELDMTMSVATSNLLSDLNLDDINLNDLKSQTDKLTDAGDQLSDGSKALSDGLSTLKNNIPTLKSGITQLDDGALTLNNGIKAYTDGVASAANGIVELSDGTSQITAGINVLSDTVRSQLVSGVSELVNGSSQLSAGIDKLSSTLTSSFEEIKKNADVYGAAYTLALKDAQSLETMATADLGGITLNSMLTQISQAATQGSADLNITTKTDLSKNLTDNTVVSSLLTKYMTAYTAAVKIETSSPQLLTQVNAVISQVSGGKFTTLSQLYSSEVGLLLQTVSNGGVYTALNQVYSQATQATDPETGLNLSQSLSALSDGANALKNGTLQLQNGIGSFDDLNPENETICSALYKLQLGCSQLSSGTDLFKNGLYELKSNSPALNNGASALKSGTYELKNASSTLSDGVIQLNEGALTLKDGMVEFNETGIKKLAGIIENDADNAVETIKQVVKLGNDYQSFAGKSDDITGSVTFIYKTDGICK